MTCAPRTHDRGVCRPPSSATVSRCMMCVLRRCGRGTGPLAWPRTGLMCTTCVPCTCGRDGCPPPLPATRCLCTRYAPYIHGRDGCPPPSSATRFPSTTCAPCMCGFGMASSVTFPTPWASKPLHQHKPCRHLHQPYYHRQHDPAFPTHRTFWVRSAARHRHES